MCSEVQIFILTEILLITLLIIKCNTNNKLEICTGVHIDRLTFTADEKKEQ